MIFTIISILFIGLQIVSASQHSPYSLQAAVDALHRREGQLALDNFEPNRYENQDFTGMGPEYYGNRQQINKMLVNFLDNDVPNDIDDNYPNQYDNNLESIYDADKRKRSMFRERDDNPNLSVFREREQQPDLAEEFLREIDRERNLAKEEQYKDQLKKMWRKYQQQENEIEQDLFDEINNEQQHEDSELFDKKPPVNGNVGPSYWAAGSVLQEKKRTLPILPWLPASRKKRFPVAKRSPKAFESEINVSGTNEKVAKDLQAIFGGQIDEKKKRASGDVAQPELSQQLKHKIEKKSDHSQHEEHDHEPDEHDHDEHEHDEHDDHYHEHSEEEEDPDFDDEDENEKKKREVGQELSSKKKSNLEVVKEDQILPGDISDMKKKSIQWSKYFGLDRRKKSYPMSTFPMPYYKSKDTDRAKKTYDEDKLKTMDQKLKNIEDLIIDETVKYTGAHEGISEPEEIEKLKDHVVSRLATAYSLEKMRRALDKLKQSVDDEKHIQFNDIIDNKRSENNDKEKKKRVATKKERVDHDHKIDTIPLKISAEEPKNSLDETKEMKKKRNGGNAIEDILDTSRFLPMSEGYMGGRNMMDQCPILATIFTRCRGVYVLSGDNNNGNLQQNLLPLCEAHQLCYLCAVSQTSCDFEYLSQADQICEHHSECQSVVRSSLMILRGLPAAQLGPRECAKSPCLFRAIKEFGF